MSTCSAMSIKRGQVVATCGHVLQRQRAVDGTGISSWLRPLSNSLAVEPQQATTEALRRAGSESAHPVSEPLRGSIEHHLGHDLSQVKVHDGPASAHAAERVGARAYTLGNDIHMGAEAHGLPRQQLDGLLTHEAVHTIQQGGGPAAPSAGLAVSSPADAAEQEAEKLANSIDKHDLSAQSSRSLALRDQLRASLPGQRIARSVSPQIQRDLTGKKSVKDGDFDLNLKTESHADSKCGMSGTIKFTASDKAPDSDSIRLLQTVRTEDLTTAKEFVWTGLDENRNKVPTTAAKGIEAGYQVDQSYGLISPRTKKTDPAISPYYIDYANSGPADNKDGSKKGKAVTEASLWDFAGSAENLRFSYETAAKATQGPHAGYTYATLNWGFTISDASKGKVEKEHAAANRAPSATFGAALDKFNEFFKNPGSSTAP